MDSSLRTAAYEIRGSYYLWGLGDHWVPNGNQVKFMNWIYAEDTNVKAVIGGHLHFGYDGVKLADNGVYEYICPPTYTGAVSVFDVTGTE